MLEKQGEMIKNITIYPHPTLPIFNAQGGRPKSKI